MLVCSTSRAISVKGVPAYAVVVAFSLYSLSCATEFPSSSTATATDTSTALESHLSLTTATTQQPVNHPAISHHCSATIINTHRHICEGFKYTLCIYK